MNEETQAVWEAIAVYAPEVPETERVPPGYKQTEIGVIPRTWEVKRLGEEATLRTGPFGSTLHKSDYITDGVPVINPMHIVDGQLVPTQTMTVRNNSAKRLSEFQLRADDIVIGRRGEMGRCAVVREEQAGWLCGTGSLIIRCTKSVVPNYLQRILSSPAVISAIEEGSVGSTMINLNQGVLGKLAIQFPPFSEQRAIASALSDVDALISSLDRLIAKKRAVKTAAMQQLLTGKRHLSGFSGEWEVKRLGEIARITMGRTPSRRVQAYWGRGHPWLSIADLTTKHLTTTKEEITEAAVADMRVIPKGTLVMSFKLTIGKLGFTHRDMYSNEAICAFNELKANAEFLYYILGRTDFSLYGKQAVKGYTLNKESLGNVEVPHPSLEEQTAIATVLSDMDAEISALEVRREKTRQVKQGMMQELLTGRTRLV